MSGDDTKKCWADGEKVQLFILTVVFSECALRTEQAQAQIWLVNYTM